MKISGRHVSVLFALFTFVLAGAAAAETPGNAETLSPKSDLSEKSQASSIISGWSMTCKERAASDANPAALACDLNNAVFVNANQQRFLAVTLSHFPAQPLRMLVALPHGVQVQAGITASIDKGEAAKLLVVSSDQSGLYASLELSAKLTTALRKGKSLQFSFTGIDGKTYNVSLDLTGLAALLLASGSVE
jgi:invasion protein IalB